MKTIENKKDCVVDQLKKFLGEKTAVVGVSGGIDSAVVASLCVEALGPMKVLGITLPYGDQDSTDSMNLIKQLGIFHVNRNIKPAVDSVCPELQTNKLTRGNIMARIRMTTLYAISNNMNGIVVGTTNRSEAEVGYYTKYGDGGVDVEPIADLWKREVYEMGELLEVPEPIMTKSPSACLWEGQTDEGEFGFTYDDIEHYFVLLEEKKIPSNWMKQSVVSKIESMIKCNDHKKHMPPSFKL
jgi:NAD+ synthase